MKSIQEITINPFKRVALVFESPEEVDKIYALLNHEKMTKAVGMDFSKVKDALAPYANPTEAAAWHQRLNVLIKK